METPFVQKAIPYGQTYHCKMSFIDLLPTFAFQKAPQDKCCLLAQLCSSGPSFSAYRLWHMPFSLCPIFILFPLMRYREGQTKEKADVQDTHAHDAQFIYCTCGVSQLESMLHSHVS